MKKIRNEITYAVACDCQECRDDTGKDFKILGFLHESLRGAQQELKTYAKSHHSSCFMVRETIEPFTAPLPQRKPKRKAA